MGARGQVGAARAGDPLPEPGAVAQVGDQQGREGRDEAGQDGHLGAGCGEPSERLGLAACQVARPGEQDPGGPAG